MSRIIWKNGLWISLVIVGIPTLSFLINGPVDIANSQREEIIGYGSIILSLLIFTFLGIKTYRDDLNHGQINYGTALKIGLAIAVIPALAFGLYNVIYTEWLDPAFMDAYFNQELMALETTLSPEEFVIQREEMLSQKEMFMNPLVNFVVMFLSVFLIGVVVSGLLALIMKKSENQVITA